MPGALRARFACKGIFLQEAEKRIDTTSKVAWKGEVTDEVFTLANVISLVRLCLIPAFFILLLQHHDVIAGILFGVAASTDWLDGTIARRTNTVSKLGRMLDPAVDRLLMIFAVIGLMLVSRLPAWIMILVLLRDVVMLFGYYIMLKRFDVRVDVILAGKIATAFLYFGLFGLFFNAPLLPGLGIVPFSWLPGFNAEPACWAIWFVYSGVLLGVFTTAYYAIIGLLACHEVAIDPEGAR